MCQDTLFIYTVEYGPYSPSQCGTFTAGNQLTAMRAYPLSPLSVATSVSLTITGCPQVDLQQVVEQLEGMASTMPQLAPAQVGCCWLHWAIALALMTWQLAHSFVG